MIGPKCEQILYRCLEEVTIWCSSPTASQVTSKTAVGKSAEKCLASVAKAGVLCGCRGPPFLWVWEESPELGFGGLIMQPSSRILKRSLILWCLFRIRARRKFSNLAGVEFLSCEGPLLLSLPRCDSSCLLNGVWKWITCLACLQKRRSSMKIPVIPQEFPTVLWNERERSEAFRCHKNHFCFSHLSLKSHAPIKNIITSKKRTQVGK